MLGDEWFGGYGRSRELRMLGAGGLVGGVVGRMVERVEGGRGERLAVVGCHDRTVGVVLGSLGCFGGERWPGFVSWVGFELLRRGGRGETPGGVGREGGKYGDYFVRVKYNDRAMVVPGCRAEGNNFEGDPSVCTLVSFLVEYTR